MSIPHLPPGPQIKVVIVIQPNSEVGPKTSQQCCFLYWKFLQDHPVSQSPSPPHPNPTLMTPRIRNAELWRGERGKEEINYF